jgi:hypothetical protein
MDIAQQLLDIRDKIDTAKTSKAKEEGKLEELNKKLLEDFNVEDIKSAKELLATMEKDLATKQQQMDTKLQKLEEGHEWD